MALLSPSESITLDHIIQQLASPAPFIDVTPPSPRSSCLHVIAVAGNWYDVPHKAPVLARLASRRTTATLLLTGGLNERLTPPRAVALGGEPLLLQAELAERHNVSRTRMVLYSGSRITNHNLQAMLMYAGATRRFDQRPICLQIVEEAFLVRREAAALRVLLDRDAAAARSLASVRVRPVGARSFAQLVATHGGRADVALALVLGEVSRLRTYAANASAAHRTSVEAADDAIDNVALPPAAAKLPGPLDAQADALIASHRAGLLATGKALLADRPALFASGAAPRDTGAGADDHDGALHDDRRRQRRERRRLFDQVVE